MNAKKVHVECGNKLIAFLAEDINTAIFFFVDNHARNNVAKEYYEPDTDVVFEFEEPYERYEFKFEEVKTRAETKYEVTVNCEKSFRTEDKLYDIIHKLKEKFVVQPEWQYNWGRPIYTFRTLEDMSLLMTECIKAGLPAKTKMLEPR